MKNPRFRYHSNTTGAIIYDFKKNLSYSLPSLKASRYMPSNNSFKSYLVLDNIIEAKIKYPELFI